MGPLSWTLAGVSAALLARLCPFYRRGWKLELVLAIVSGGLAGLAATALDFGGWSELDWLAVPFILCTSLTSIAVLRLFRAMSSDHWRTS